MKPRHHLLVMPRTRRLVSFADRLLNRFFNTDLSEVIQQATFQSGQQSPQHQYRVNILVAILTSLLVICLCLIIYGVLGIVLTLFDDPGNRLLTLIILPGLVSLANIRVLYAMKRGNIQAAGRIVVGVTFCGILLAAYFSGGLYSTAMLGLMVIVVMATVLMDIKSISILLILTMVSFFLLLLVELTGLMPVVESKDLLFRLTALICTILSLFALISYYTYAIQRSEQRIADLRTAAKRHETQRELTQNLAHDLRTPITILKTNAYLMQKRHEKGMPLDENMLKMDRHLNQLNMMIDDLLELAFLDDSDSIEIGKSVNLRSLIISCVASFEDYARQHNIILHLEDEIGSDIYAKGDAAYLRRAFDNLIENAIHFGRDGGKVFLFLRHQNDQIEILVQDDGIGISPQYHESVFDRFFRVDPARTSDEAQGTGIGLSIVKKIIHLHSGSIGLESELGKGSTFRVSLPAQPIPSA